MSDQQSQETGFIIRISQHVEIAQIESNAYYLEPYVRQGKKALLQRVVRKLASAKQELMELLPQSAQEHLKQHVIDEETAMAIQAVQHMIMDLPKGMRDEIESYVRSRYNVYKLNKRTT